MKVLWRNPPSLGYLYAEGSMTYRVSQVVAAVALAACLTTGCKSKEEQALEQAKAQAASTGQAQQIVTVDKNGNTTTTVVQPPQPGQASQVVTTTTTTSAPAAQGPVVSPAVGGVPANTPASANGGPVSSGSAPLASGQPAAAGQPVAPVAGGGPVVSAVNVSIPAGTDLAIRINQHISVKTSRAGDHFTGEVAEPVSDANGRPLVPQGTPVGGLIDASHRRGHFKGRSILELRLTSMTLNGQQYPIDTRDLTRTKKGKGKRSAAFIGGGAGLGMLIGGVASGGVGLLAGGLAGGGAGTAIAGLTGNRDIEIPAESIMRFRLADDLVVQGR